MTSMQFDADKAILTITLRGYILPPGMVNLHSSIKRKITRLRVSQFEIGIVCDCVELHNMTNLISEWNVMLGRWTGRISCPFAFVVEQTISPPALEELLTAPDVAVFHDASDARAWLMRSRFTVVPA